MKLLVSIILIAAISFAACLYLPWWLITVAGFVVAAVIPQKPILSFLSGFLGGFLLWAGMSWWLSAANEHLFAHKISLLIIKTDSPFLLIAVTGLIGGLAAGLGALTGSFVRSKKLIVDR